MLDDLDRADGETLVAIAMVGRLTCAITGLNRIE